MACKSFDRCKVTARGFGSSSALLSTQDDDNSLGGRGELAMSQSPLLESFHALHAAAAVRLDDLRCDDCQGSVLGR